MFNFITLAFVFLSLVMIVQTRPNGDQNFALSAMMILTVYGCARQVKRRVGITILSAPLLLAVVSVFYSTHVVVMNNCLNMFAGILAIKVVAENYTAGDSAMGLVGVLFFMVSLAVLLFQLLGMEYVYFPAFDEPAGASFRPWILGCSVCILLPFVFQYSKTLSLLALPLLWYSRSSVCFAIAISSVILLLCLKYKISKKWLLLTIPLSIAYFSFDSFDHNRIEVWKNSYKYIQNIWIGNGFGSWAHSAFIHQASEGGDYLVWLWAHNEFYQHFFEQGIVGLGLVLFASVALLKMAKSHALKVSLLVIYGLSMVHPVFHWGKLSFLVVVLIGLAIKEGAEYDYHRLRSS